MAIVFFFFSSRRRHTRLVSDWSSDVCSSDLDGWRSVQCRFPTDWSGWWRARAMNCAARREPARGANPLFKLEHGPSHGVAEDDSPRRKPWEQGETAISPVRGDRILLLHRAFFRRCAALNLPTQTHG